ncbi:MAG: VOC family protein [Steroidobacteraceae bacterium]|jgi:predicted enzyme related to lactoylglutathione lyase
MNTVVHFEIGGKDLAKSSAFYSALFGWKILDGPASMIEGAGLTGHLNALGHEPFNYTVVYVGVNDIKAAIVKAEALGAKTLVGPIAIPTGQFAWISDPTGTTIGLWQAA